ncbi:hypothetical protein K456DRAFT_1745551 [Colletotrichum gloeosporioides 23]|nr:hypothetical protein K456DRAFT_1745551 [Colletotrichum gloeosporioides 23]
MYGLIIGLGATPALASCDVEPVALPIQDVQVDPNVPDSYMRGIPAKLGTPSQNIVMLPWARGNLFREDDSTTFIKATDIVSAGGAPEEITTAGTEIGVKKLISTSIGGNDDLDIGSTSLNNTPLGIPTLRWDNGYTMLHALGLGANLTYLTSLAQASQLGSRKVTGKNFTQRLDYSESTGCWTGMKVTVTDVQVNFRDGSDKSIMPLNTALQCCINVTNSKDTGVSFGLHWSARTFAAGDAFDGDLTFYLSSGLQVRVPNNQYIVPYVDIERNGSRSISKSTKELLISGLSDQPATLGRYFLTAAYLMVDHDSETFTMWQANPTTRSSLVKVTSDKSNCGKPQTSRVAVFPTSTATSGSDASGGSSSSGDQSGLSTGAIAGIAVGGVAGLAAVGLGIFCFLRAKKRKAVPSMPPPYNPEYTTAMAQEAWPKYGHTQGTSYEVQGSQGYQASELRGQDHFVYEMDEGNSQRR